METREGNPRPLCPILTRVILRDKQVQKIKALIPAMTDKEVALMMQTILDEDTTK